MGLRMWLQTPSVKQLPTTLSIIPHIARSTSACLRTGRENANKRSDLFSLSSSIFRSCRSPPLAFASFVLSVYFPQPHLSTVAGPKPPRDKALSINQSTLFCHWASVRRPILNRMQTLHIEKSTIRLITLVPECHWNENSLHILW